MLPRIILIFSCAAIAFATTSQLQLLDGERIVGGSLASLGEFPWQVSIQYMGQHICGGSIISKDYLLTSVQCSLGLKNVLQVVAGTVKHSSPGSIHNITEFINNSAFNSSNFENDIAIWKISPPFNFDANTSPIALPAQGNSSSTGTVMMMSGWGTTWYGGFHPEVLRKVDLPIFDKAVCESNYAAILGGIRPNQICAGYAEGALDACQGDTGGALVWNSEIRGIFSWGNGCASANYPGVYTEVSAYRDWINEKTGI